MSATNTTETQEAVISKSHAADNNLYPPAVNDPGAALKKRIAAVIDSQRVHLFLVFLTFVDTMMVVADMLVGTEDRCAVPVEESVFAVQFRQSKWFLDSLSRAILITATTEILLRIYVYGLKEYTDSAFQITDGVLLILSWIVELVSDRTQWLGKFVSLLMISRLWRIIKVVDVIALTVSEAAEDDIKELKAEIERLKAELAHAQELVKSK